MASFEPKPFGKYFLIEKIAVGGMAEIYKAKTFGVDGFEKLIAIKKILTHYSSDKEFISMLTDEAKLAVRLSHTNIVQIYDLGKVGDDYFISMEFIDGVNLREVINRAKEVGDTIPLPVCLYIISEICKGLDYAHSKRDDRGKPLNIVHRDISPQNILISFEGESKIVDFGIAKAAMNISHTSAGILKGKINYMAPEQALGKPVDSKADVFSAGLLLYELFTGEKLFRGDTQFEVLKKIRTTNLKEADFKDKVPQEIAAILAKALAFSPNDRYETAGDFQIDLTRLLYSSYTDFAPKQLSQLIKKWFEPELKLNKQKALQEPKESHTKSVVLESPVVQENIVSQNKTEDHSDTDSSIFYQDTTKPQDILKPSDFKDDDFSISHQSKRKIIIDEKDDNSEAFSGLDDNVKKPFSKKIVFILVILLIVTGAYFVFHNKDHLIPDFSTHKKSEFGTLLIETEPPDATISINGKKIAETSPTQIENIKLHKAQMIHLELDGYKSIDQSIKLSDDKPKKLEVRLTPLPMGGLQVNSDPEGAQIWINGKNTEKLTPFKFEKIDASKPIRVKIVEDRYKPITQEITLEKDHVKELSVKLESLLKTMLEISSDPEGADIYIDDKKTEFKTPYTFVNLDENKEINIKVAKEGYKSSERSFTLEKGKSQHWEEPLTALPKEVDYTIKGTPDADIYLENEKIGTTNAPINILPGEYDFTFKKDGYKDLTKSVEILQDENEELTIELEKIPVKKAEVKEGSITITSNPSGGSVLIGGKTRGTTPLTLTVSEGTHRIQVRKSGYDTYYKKVTVKSNKTSNVNASLQLTKQTTENKTIATPPPKDTKVPENIGGVGSLRIDSTPRGAAVIFNGRKAGITPVVIPNVQPGQSNSISLSLPGYSNWSRSVTLQKRYQEINATMQRGN